MGDDPNQRGNSRRWIMTAVENSLRRLQTDRIDLYQIHRPDPDTDTEVRPQDGSCVLTITAARATLVGGLVAP
jgi:aryl-alcohol dehydrogenase-like predicted oxidoreductase